MTATFDDTPPPGGSLTDYDRAHVRLYMRMLDAADEGADWREVVSVLCGLDAAREPDRAHKVYASHLARAKWMTEAGYWALLGKTPPAID